MIHSRKLILRMLLVSVVLNAPIPMACMAASGFGDGWEEPIPPCDPPPFLNFAIGNKVKFINVPLPEAIVQVTNDALGKVPEAFGGCIVDVSDPPSSMLTSLSLSDATLAEAYLFLGNTDYPLPWRIVSGQPQIVLFTSTFRSSKITQIRTLPPHISVEVDDSQDGGTHKLVDVSDWFTERGLRLAALPGMTKTWQALYDRGLHGLILTNTQSELELMEALLLLVERGYEILPEIDSAP